jgi:hypothetical protein
MTSRTRLRKGWILAVALLLAAPALAQPDDRRDEDTQLPPEERSSPVFSLNVSPELLINAINRLVEKRLTKDYGFDEYQAEEMRHLLQEELPRFLEEHQAELETLATEWLEAVSADEPPSAERAADWAARLRPIVEEAEVMVDRVSDNMREFLNDDQQVLLDGFQAGIHTAARGAKGRLYEFEQGYFDPEKHWPGSRKARRRGPKEIKSLRKEMEVARRDAMGGDFEPIAPPPPRDPSPDRAARRAARSTDEHALAEDESPAPAQPAPEQAKTDNAPAPAKTVEKKDEWTLYVEAFIKRYKLDDEQQQKARHFLKRAHDNRDRYFAGRGSEMERITKMWRNAKTEKQRTTVEKAHAKFAKPLDGMFERLKRDLDKLPTRGQRRAAATSEVKLPEPGTSAKKVPADAKSP